MNFCKGSIQYSGVSERPRTAFKIGSAHMHNQAWKDKASENIPAMCKIRYTVNRVVLLDIKGYTGCPRRSVPDFGRVFVILKYTDITQNTKVERLRR